MTDRRLLWFFLVGVCACVGESPGSNVESSRDEIESANTTKVNTTDCEDASRDCEQPKEKCVEAYCDADKRCAERPKANGTVLEGWTKYEACEYVDECAETAPEVKRVLTICEDGRVEEEYEFKECPTRDTEGKTVQGGMWGDCQAVERDGSCVQLRTRSIVSCKDGRGIEGIEEDLECSAKGEQACGVCGNGIVEPGEGEECEEGDEYCVECDRVIFVDGRKDGDGRSWAQAIPKLQDALVRAAAFIDSGELTQIWVAAGRYTNEESEGGNAFVVPHGVELYGGFEGTESSIEPRNEHPLSNKTILSGEIDGVEGTNVVAIYNADARGAYARLDGFTIEKGKDGAGVSIVSGQYPSGTAVSGRINETYPGRLKERTKTLEEDSAFDVYLANLRVQHNSRTGVYIKGEGISVVFEGENLIVENNTTAKSGGGIRLSNAKITINGSTVISDHELAGFGGGFACTRDRGEGLIKVSSRSELILRNNVVYREGGGFYNSECTILVSGEDAVLRLESNTAFEDGGGFYNGGFSRTGYLARVIVEDGGMIELEGNRSYQNGGGFFNWNGTMIERDGGFFEGSGNQADEVGDGFFNQAGALNGKFENMDGEDNVW